ncbi:MAG: lysophospholipid acyltransferase family protein [Alphaproteobacteria bacterium]
MSGTRLPRSTVTFSGAETRLRHAAEAAGAYQAFAFFRLLPVDVASAIGGWIFRALGPLAPAHRTADRNIRAALPGLSASERRDLLRRMWDNLGRVTAEFAHLERLAEDPARVEIEDPENLLARAASAGSGAVLITAHYGNWELGCLPAIRAGGKEFDVYRAANNPHFDKLLKRTRMELARAGLIPKGPAAMRKCAARLRQGDFVGMIVDQKTNEGILADFFGRKAMTTRAPAVLAHRLGCPIILILVERVGGAAFLIRVREIKWTHSGDLDRDVERTTCAINAAIEAAVRARPELWFWVHRRWPG